MLTQDEEKFLATIPEDKLIEIRPYDPQIKKVVDQLISEVKLIIPEADIHFMGASALELAGQNDIDLYLFSSPEQIAIFRDKLIPLFGKPSLDKSFVEWDFLRDGFNVEFYITDPNTESMQRQIKVFNLLSSHEEFRDEYETMKLKYNGRSFREYQRLKYEFYNRILSL